MNTINEKQDDIIDEFSGFDDWLDRYQLLIDLGSEQPPLEEQYKTDNNLICTSAKEAYLAFLVRLSVGAP